MHAGNYYWRTYAGLVQHGAQDEDNNGRTRATEHHRNAGCSPMRIALEFAHKRGLSPEEELWHALTLMLNDARLYALKDKDPVSANPGMAVALILT